MFTVLDIAEPPKRRFPGRLIHSMAVALRGPDTEILSARAGRVRYYIIRTETVHGEPDWQKICRTAGREAYRMIMPEKVCPPPGVPAAAYDCSEYLRRVFCNTVFSVLDRLKHRAQSSVIAFYDPEARFGSVAFGMIKYARLVRVITARRERYEVFSDRAMERYGAGMIISEKAEIPEKCNIVIAPAGLSGCGECPRGAAVFDMDGQRGYAVTKDCIRLPAKYTAELPEGISEADFAAALFERARLCCAGSFVPRFLTCRGKKVSLYDVLAAAENTMRGV